MVTYETLVDATLAHGLMPLVVPQLKTITLGGAVAGLGIESSSFRNGLPHESVREMEVLTGDGRVVVARPDNEHADLFRGLPQLLRHARLRAAAAPSTSSRSSRTCGCGTCASTPPRSCFAAMAQVCADGASRRASRWTSSTAPSSARTSSTSRWPRSSTTRRRSATTPAWTSTTGRSSARQVDYLTVRDYLWRWDTDWFWCSRAFGVQQPWYAGSGRAATAAPTCTARWSRSTAGTGSPPGWPGCAGAGRGARRPGRRDPGRAGRRSSWTSSTATSASSRSGCARCGCAAAQPWPLYPLEPGRALRQRGLLVDACRWRRARPTATTTG